VNGQCVTDVTTKVDADSDCVKVGRRILTRPARIYIIMHKPRGVITTREDTHCRKTVLDLLPVSLRHVHAVGRLDKDTTGLLLLTNDGALTLHLTHPRYHIPKTYDLEVAGVIENRTIERLKHGIVLEDGKTRPAEVLSVTNGRNKTRIVLRIREGRKRQIRRMMKALGATVNSLKRTEFGPLRLGMVREGSYRVLEKKEVQELQDYIHAYDRTHTKNNP